MSMYLIDGAILENIAEEIRKIKGNPGVKTITPEEIIEELKTIRSCVGECYLEVTSEQNSRLQVQVPKWKNCLFRAKLTDKDGKVAYSDAAMLTVAGYVAITKQPVDVVAAEGDTVTFSVEAIGDGLSYQWQYSQNDGVKWYDSGAASAKTAAWTQTLSAYATQCTFRCIVTDANGNTVESASARIINPSVLTITKQPVDVTAAVSDTVSFSVEAVGDGLTYQWQYFGNTATSWVNIPTGWTGYNTNTLTFNVTETRALNLYRCVITDSNGNRITTNEVKLYVKSAVIITEQPQSYESKSDDGNHDFCVKATNCVLFDWQYSRDGKTWQNILSSDDRVHIACARLCDLAWYISTLKG